MFLNTFKSDVVRWFNIKKIALVSAVFVAVMIAGQYGDYIKPELSVGYELANGIVATLANVLMFDKFKIIMVFLLAALYTNSFCTDDSTHYLRMVLNRTNVACFTCSRFLVNALGVTAVSIVCFWLAAFVLMPFMRFAPLQDYDACYYDAVGHPAAYVFLMGFQFGIAAAAFCSAGLAFSAFQPNSFVSTGITGLAFYLSVSYIPEDSVFDMLQVVSLAPSFIKSFDAPKAVNLAWSIIYPLAVVAVCGYVFYRRMEWRMEHGNI